MKEQNSLAQLFAKLDDLKDVFEYGQKIIPVLHSLIEFMKDTIPLLENVNDSIRESTSQMPKAANQINDVTSATELATTEILDTVDATTNTIEKIKTQIGEHIQSEKEKECVIEELKKTVAGNKNAESLIKKYFELNHSSDKLTDYLNNVTQISDNLFNITLSLQVQDITSQQLAAVNHLIQSVQSKLGGLMTDLDQADLEKDIEDLEISVPESATFDPAARYSKDKKNQDLADSLTEDHKNRTTQDEIDKLFS
jgi:chemotaxis regulatin CheY-phosphate phosphatase CheZ